MDSRPDEPDLARVEDAARAERRAELDNDRSLLVRAEEVRYRLTDEWQSDTGRTILDIEVADEAVPTIGEARAIVERLRAKLDRHAQTRHVAAARRRARALEAEARFWGPGATHWCQQARRARQYVTTTFDAKASAAIRPRERRGHGGQQRPRARRSTSGSRSSAGGGDPGGGDPPGEPEHEPQAVPPLAGRDRRLADTFSRLGVIA